MIHMVLCTRRSTHCGLEFLLSQDLSQVGSRSLWSRSWQTLCRRSGRKSWSLLLVRSSATLVQASGDITGGRAQLGQIVDVRVPQIQEKIVEVMKVTLREQCQRVLFFLLTAWAARSTRVAPQPTPTRLPHARVDSECKRWNGCCIYWSTPPS